MEPGLQAHMVRPAYSKLLMNLKLLLLLKGFKLQQFLIILVQV